MALPGVTVFPMTPPSLGQGFRARPLNFVIVSGDSYENMARAAQAIIAEMQKNPGIVQPDSDLQLNKPEIFIEVDRARAADMGVSVDAVARTVETHARRPRRHALQARRRAVRRAWCRPRAAAAPRPRTSTTHLRARPQRDDGAAVVAGARCARR